MTFPGSRNTYSTLSYVLCARMECCGEHDIVAHTHAVPTDGDGKSFPFLAHALLLLAKGVSQRVHG